MADGSSRGFAAVTAVTRRDEFSFAGAVSPDWTIGGRPNGGYLLAMLGRAAIAVSPHDHVVAASAQFVDSPDPGPVVISVELLRAGRSTSQLRARMQQDERACVEALFTVSHLGGDARPYWAGGVPPLIPGTRGEATRLGPRVSGMAAMIMEHVEIHLDADSAGFTAGEPSGRGELRGWLSLPEPDSADPLALLFAADCFPAATFEIEDAGWVPTLQLTVYVRARPVAGPYRIVQRAQLVEGGRVDETCFVWDVRGRLVAHGTQLAAVRLG